MNTLDPPVSKEKFFFKEDIKIMKFFKKYGSKWSLIAKNFDKRTCDMIKNKFYSSLKKYIPNKNELNSGIENCSEVLSFNQKNEEKLNEEQKFIF